MGGRYDFGFETNKCLRLCRVEEILREVIDPVPSRDTLVGLIEDGTLDGVKMSFGWVVYESSLVSWVRSFQPQSQAQPSRQNKVNLKLAASK